MTEQSPKFAEPDTTGLFDCRGDFPALQQDVNGHSLVYLDSAASSQPPAAVISAVAEYQAHDHANVHRGVHTLSHRATEAYEGARDQVRSFINAGDRSEIVFTRGTTESVNLVAQSLSPADAQTGRPDPDHTPRTPFQYCSVAAGL